LYRAKPSEEKLLSYAPVRGWCSHRRVEGIFFLLCLHIAIIENGIHPYEGVWIWVSDIGHTH